MDCPNDPLNCSMNKLTALTYQLFRTEILNCASNQIPALAVEQCPNWLH
ncbi:MAG: hypothetical protein ACLSFT_06690 [Ruminococcus callidus]